ncbi:MAG: FHA domain-containing protein [Planctomycetes bacterium]|nr:FHA domain-containing protein [Planctomycetota bacterium]
MAFLIIETGPEQGRKIDLRGPLIVGRQAKIGLSIKDAKASREHTSFEPAAGGYAVVDMGSTNGTLLNGRKIERDFLKAGDRVTVGQTVFRFEEADAMPEASTRPMKDPNASVPVGRTPGGYPPAAPVTPRPAPRTATTGRLPDALPAGPSPAAIAASAAMAANAVPTETKAPKLRYQEQSGGPGFFAIVICTAILVGLVFAARWIGQRAIAKALADKKQEQKAP